MKQKKLIIKNYNKLIGCFAESKWIPEVEGYFVNGIEQTDSAYILQIKNNKNIGSALQINIERDMIGDEVEIWGWGIDGMPKRIKKKGEELDSPKKTILWICFVIGRIIGANSVAGAGGTVV